MPLYPPYMLIDDFLAPDLHDALIDHALRHHAQFTRATIRKDGANTHGNNRKAWTCSDFGTLKKPVLDAMAGTSATLFKRLGMKACAPERIEIEMTAHRDGDYFRPHRDTFVGKESASQTTERMITAIYYFHTAPKRFTGGEFAIHPLGEGAPLLFEPKDNRLLAIPAFALHEVRAISCEGDAFSASRFAVNAWFHRRRDGG